MVGGGGIQRVFCLRYIGHVVGKGFEGRKDCIYSSKQGSMLGEQQYVIGNYDKIGPTNRARYDII